MPQELRPNFNAWNRKSLMQIAVSTFRNCALKNLKIRIRFKEISKESDIESGIGDERLKEVEGFSSSEGRHYEVLGGV